MPKDEELNEKIERLKQNHHDFCEEPGMNGQYLTVHQQTF